LRRTGRADDARLAHALRSVPLFREVPAADLVSMWRCLEQMRVPAGHVLCERGEPGDKLYMVQAGLLEVRLGLGPDGVVLRQVGPGDFVGELALLIDEPRSADVVVLQDALLWVLDRAEFERLMQGNAALLRVLNRALCDRVAVATRILWERERGERSGPLGLRFGPYRAIAQLGVGAMAAVYSAIDSRTESAAAVKVLPAAWGEAPELQARLAREADVLRRIAHPNVVAVLDVGPVETRLGGGCYLAMEWLPNALDRVLRARYPDALPPAEALRLGLGVAEGLAAVHSAGLVHRDVKPANVLLRSDGSPVLTDFGLATTLAETALRRRLTPTNVIVGTADYLAPEQIAGGPPDPRTDLYALGVTLYEMLAGYVPFAGRDPLETLRSHQEEEPPPLPPEVPPVVCAIVERALQKRPEARFDSASAMAAALGSALEEVQRDSP
jgi:CRP-like cAMP-binding protein